MLIEKCWGVDRLMASSIVGIPAFKYNSFVSFSLFIFNSIDNRTA